MDCWEVDFSRVELTFGARLLDQEMGVSLEDFRLQMVLLSPEGKNGSNAAGGDGSNAER